MAVVLVVKQDLFGDLGVVIIVALLVLEEDIPTLLSIKGMLQIGLDISIQEHDVSLC